MNDLIIKNMMITMLIMMLSCVHHFNVATGIGRVNLNYVMYL